MPRPILYFVRHGETDWNRGAPAAGPARHPAQCARPRAGGALRRDSARPARARRPAAGRLRLRVEPARPRPRDDGADARGAGPRSGGLPHRRAADGNVVRPLGGLHLRRVAGARGARRWRRASATNGASCCRAARATRSSQVRVRAWYESVERDTVVSAHGGVCRALIAHLGIWRSPRPPRWATSGRAWSTCSMATAMTRHE